MKVRTAEELVISRAVGARVRQLRTARGLSVQALADRTADSHLALTRSGVYTIERGEHGNGGLRAVCVDELVVLAAALGAEPSVLMRPPDCDTCLDAAPEGFTCKACGVAS